MRTSNSSKRMLLALLLATNCAFPVADVNAAAPAATSDQATDKVLLKGGVTESVSPIATDGSKNDVPVGTNVSMTVITNVNSELSKIGDEVVAMVSTDVREGDKVLLPGQWFAHGTVTEVEHQKRLGRDGYLTVKFDKLVSPDGKYEIPIDASASTKESTAKTVAKVVGKDSIYVTKGAVAGTILSAEITGIPGAIATHGISLGVGAAGGALIGLFGALKRKGNIAAGLRGEELQFRIDKPVTLPAFVPEALPSAIHHDKIANLDITVERSQFRADPFGDKRSRLLQVNFKFDNKTERTYSFSNLAVVSDHNQMYYPYAMSIERNQLTKRVLPNSTEEGSIIFGVDSPKRKYFLVLMDRGNKEELTRVPLN